MHHLVEKRFASKLGIRESEIPSIVLTKEEHRVFTKKWRDTIPYGSNYKNEVSIDDLITIYHDIYADYPNIIEVLDNFIQKIK